MTTGFGPMGNEAFGQVGPNGTVPDPDPPPDLPPPGTDMLISLAISGEGDLDITWFTVPNDQSNRFKFEMSALGVKGSPGDPPDAAVTHYHVEREGGVNVLGESIWDYELESGNGARVKFATRTLVRNVEHFAEIWCPQSQNSPHWKWNFTWQGFKMWNY